MRGFWNSMSKRVTWASRPCVLPLSRTPSLHTRAGRPCPRAFPPSGIVFVALLLTLPALAEPWPTYRHDSRRSGVTAESPALPLAPAWTRKSPLPPRTAWTGPAKWDAFSGNSGLQSMRNFDPCFYVTATDGQVFFGSSVDDAVHALDAATGEENWVAFTKAAVRFPPSLDSGRALFGSDDGFVYCVDSQSGDPLWKMQAAPTTRRISSNRRLISTHPVRTGVLIHEGRAYFAASLVPWQPSLLWSVDPSSGIEEVTGGFRQEIGSVTLQGALLASPDRLYVPQGRSAPLTFERDTGKGLGSIGEAGGVFCILTEDELLLAGPQNQKAGDSEIRIARGGEKKRVATFSGTERIVVAGGLAWMHIGDQLKHLDRAAFLATADDDAKKAAWKWSVPCEKPHDLILAGEVLFMGFRDRVAARSAEDGSLLWEAPVEGIAHGLTFSDGRLFVSTGLGHIHAFEGTKSE